MSTETIVLLHRVQYQFPTVELASKARDWIAARGMLASYGDFLADFPEAIRVDGLPGAGSFNG